MRYNVGCILSGNLAPSVQITVQPISVEGLIALRPLLEQPDTIVRDGVAAAVLEKAAGRTSLERQKNGGIGLPTRSPTPNS